ncbi:phosphoribosylamine--glycine ligase [Pontibacter ummariensis]|uniref:Phosphoribosylamine--glycine ligase n=1 Tax=Pontibacter ummariensis TaxID=1610492 RepID=A0A239B7E0_9BACT|nr:phosphoribosylamine--glycine ligase [Pontibacter ummariensis]PRY16342.1 phosphoribosylamine--glycine ligase [Pontibacter ummariensis]SNS03461.1 phosphoribosylamine--glycine ligase [Pontibacter ummariensis]
MNVLIIGSGAREHAIAWKLSQSEYCEKVFVAPGNAGTAKFGTTAAVDIHNFNELAKFATDFDIMMLVVGSENSLVEGIHDYFQSSEYLKHILVVGPKKAGAMLEGSKDYCKAFLQKYGIPTARYQTFTEDTFKEAASYLRDHSYPAVIKADGLAAGKGVIIAQDYEEAISVLEDMLRNKRFGSASSKVVIEEYLQGIEVSVFILTDGKDYVLLPEAKDYKRIGEGDTGLNTGGMGAVSPVPFVDDAFMQKVKDRVIAPTLRGMQEEKMDYTGFLFIGLMNVNGDPYVIEYNVRLGDPETEAILPRIKSDLFELFRALHEHKLGEFKLEIDPRTATTVFLVSGGYPEGFEKGKEISGLAQVPKDVLVFHAGTKELNGKLLNNGGRVIAVTALADTMDEALAKANAAAEAITWDDRYYRRDIGFDLRGIPA